MTPAATTLTADDIRAARSLIWSASIDRHAGDWCPACGTRVSGRFGSRKAVRAHIVACEPLQRRVTGCARCTSPDHDLSTCPQVAR